MQQQFDFLMAAIKGAKKAPQKPPWQRSNQGQKNNNQNTTNNDQTPQIQSSNWNKNATRSEYSSDNM